MGQRTRVKVLGHVPVEPSHLDPDHVDCFGVHHALVGVRTPFRSGQDLVAAYPRIVPIARSLVWITARESARLQ